MNPTLKNLLEGYLFVRAGPQSIDALAKRFSASETGIRAAAEELARENEGRGIRVVISDAEVELVTAPELSVAIAEFVKTESGEHLSAAALETLAIIAYAGPVEKSAIDALRGVNSGYMVSELLARGLIDRHSDAQKPHVFMYEPSVEFMKFFGVQNISDFPDHEIVRSKLKNRTAPPVPK